MKSSVDWCDDAENAALDERATVADVRLSINDINVTQHLFEGVLCDHVTVSLYGLAHGIAHDWWTIFGTRDHHISLLKYRDGYVLPDIRVRFDGVVFELGAQQRMYRNPDVRFWGGTSEVMTRERGEAMLADLVQLVLDRLAAAGLSETGASLRWKRVQASRNSAEATFCEAAGSLRLDPYEISENAAAFIDEAEGMFDGEALVEFVAGSAGVDQFELLQWVKDMRGHQGFGYRVANLRSVIDEAYHYAPPKVAEEAWALGYRRARALRRVLNLSQGQRFSSFRDLARRLGAGAGYRPAPKVDGIRALRSERRDGIQIHLRNHGDSAEAKAAHLFAMARTVGDAACFPDPQLAPVNDLRNASRQAAGRAFAAEFLAPIDEIRSMQRDRRDLITIANEFSVSTHVVERQLENEKRIEQSFDQGTAIIPRSLS